MEEVGYNVHIWLQNGHFGGGSGEERWSLEFFS